ncbi:MAG TPA: SDR family oxidoreductase [Acidimicrobiales bacterium]|jgi:NAD(P)-dependent dehydrogenase (short-subunit alcohol dehydrogenase family)|nr:SDR family oxidoreductase [Acidimicrobiales bacterium]
MTDASVVVGGASGIGAAIAAAQRSARRTVLVWDIAAPNDIACDVREPKQIEAAMAETVERLGAPDEVTVCAGIGHGGLLLDIEPEEWDQVMAVNARGPWLAMRAAAKAMIEADLPGSIVVTSSISSRLADRYMGAYCSSKAALNMLVKVAAREWAPHGIRVNAVAPGATNTPILGGAPLETGWLKDVADRTSLGRIGEPVDIAEAVLGLHQMHWVTGHILDCDGGLSLYSPVGPF